MRGKFRKEDIGSLWTPDEGENIQAIYRLQELVSEPQATMVPVSTTGSAFSQSGPLSGPVSEFKNFRRLTIPKPRVRKAEAAKKPRKERKDKGTTGIRKPRRKSEWKEAPLAPIAKPVISPLTEAGQENLGKPYDPIGRTQKYQTLQSCSGCGVGLVMSFQLDSSVEVPQHWVTFCPGCGKAVCIANKDWDDMAEIK